MKEFKIEKDINNELGYVLYEPEKIEGDLPMIVFLHGAGERGKGTSDWLELVKKNAIPKYIGEGSEFPAIVVCPQCPLEFVWNNMVRELKALIDELSEKYGIPHKRISITGLSMGGFGTWEMALTYPETFNAFAPVCGGGMSWRTPVLKNERIWAFHGDMDFTVPLNNSLEMVDALKKHGGNAKFTIFHDIEHNSWDNAYLETTVIDWMIK